MSEFLPLADNGDEAARGQKDYSRFRLLSDTWILYAVNVTP
jgi:hypothetical protein